MKVVLLLVLTAAVPLSPARPSAQEAPAELIRAARVQMELLDLDSARTLLRRALAPEGQAPVSWRVRGFVLLGITELNVGSEAEARAAFRQALTLDAAVTVDSLEYMSSALQSVFGAVRAQVVTGPSVDVTTLEVTGLPPRAVLRVDGVRWETARRRVAPGSHQISVTADGYLPFSAEVTVRRGGAQVFSVAMEEAPPALLSVGGVPYGNVYLDGQLLGETPIVNRPVRAGPRTVTVAVPGRPPRDTLLTLIAGITSALPMTDPAARAQRAEFPFTRADSLYLAADFLLALPLYQRIVHDSGLAVTNEQRSRAALRAGAVLHGHARSVQDLALYDSAQAYLQTAYALAPAAAPGPGEFGPELQTMLQLARSAAFSVGVDLASDALVPPGEAWRVTVRPSRPATVWVELHGSSGAVLLADTQTVEQSGVFPWGLRAPGDSLVATGEHRLFVGAIAGDGGRMPVSEFVVTVSRVPVDTIVSSAEEVTLLPEARPVSRWGRIAAGVLLGGVAAAIPAWSGVAFGGSDDQPGAVAGGAVAVASVAVIAGVVGFVAGSREKPLPANIAANRLALRRHAERVAEVASANARIRAAAPARITVRRIR